MAAYEVLNTFVTNAAIDSLPIVAKLSDVILQRLEGTIQMQQQIVSVDDRNTLEEIQTSLTSVLLVSHTLLGAKTILRSYPRLSYSASKAKSSRKQIGLCKSSSKFSLL